MLVFVKSSKMTFTDISAVVVLICTFTLLNLSSAANEHCFTFKGDSYLLFMPSEPFDNNNNIHYQFEFKTESPNGVLMYARGPNEDREAVYIRGGKLHYHLFNTGRGGVGRQFGGDFVSEETVNGNQWIEVHVYRSWRPSVNGARHSRPEGGKTGIEFVLNGQRLSYVDYRARQGIDISSNIYFGGYMTSLSSSVGNFTGQIRGIREHENNHLFEYPSLNYRSLVDFQCQD